MAIQKLLKTKHLIIIVPTILHDNNVLTWFLPLSTSTLVTFPNGMPRCMTSASVTSLGMLRMCITRDGLLLAVLSSLTWNFFYIIKTHWSAKRPNQDGRWDLGPHASRTHRRLWLSRGPQTNDRANSILRPKGAAPERMGERDEVPVVELLFTAFL